MSSGTQGLLANDFIPFLQQTTGIKLFEENVPLIDNKDNTIMFFLHDSVTIFRQLDIYCRVEQQIVSLCCAYGLMGD